jgi:hypothetical protein
MSVVNSPTLLAQDIFAQHRLVRRARNVVVLRAIG